MNRKIRFLVLFSFSILFLTSVNAQSNIKYGEDYVVFEAEDTDTPLGNLWTIRTPDDPEYLKYYTNPNASSPNPFNDTYLEYTGPWQGAGSDLVYKFTCPKTGAYRVGMRMHCPLRNGELADKRNDVFIKMEGNYTSGNSNLTKSDLESLHKFYGRGPNNWGSCLTLEFHDKGHQRPVYNLIEGEEYTFTMKGRSNGASYDYIAFYTYSTWINQNTDLALQLPEAIRPNASNSPDVSSVSLNESDINIVNINDTFQLVETVNPQSAVDKTVTWSSSNNAVATVSASGLVTAISEGEATITVTTTDGDFTATCDVLVGEIQFQDINWSVVQLVDGTEVITDGTLLEAINFGGGANDDDLDTTINTVTFEGKASGAATGNPFANPTTSHFSSTSQNVVPGNVDQYDAPPGLPVYDNLLSKFLWNGSGGSTMTISGLEIGKSYMIQLFMGDKRAEQVGSFIIVGAENDPNPFGDASTTGYANTNGIVISGGFVAESTSFNLYSVKDQNGSEGFNLNGYQLREVASLSTKDNTVNNIKVYPNPVKEGIIHISNLSKELDYQIINVQGKTLKSGRISKSKTIDVSELNTGLYFIRMNDETGSTTKKFIITN
ncbi:MAG: Ig-like domain-containing protein [Jejuia sp.]